MTKEQIERDEREPFEVHKQIAKDVAFRTMLKFCKDNGVLTQAESESTKT